MPRSVLKLFLASALVALLSNCATLAPSPPPVSQNAAVVALVEQARTEAASGKPASAAGSVERALRIEPRNPYLWQELARLRLAQGDFAQAENLAVRANTWAGSDRSLRSANWQLIGEARAARGDSLGAEDALRRARQFGR